MITNEARIKALAKFLGVEPSSIEMLGYDEGRRFETEKGEYLVLTDKEADEKVRESIRETLWAFTPHFLASTTGIEEAIFKVLAPICEGANEAIVALVNGTCGMDYLIEEAILWDGRGHFLAGYDGEEQEQGDFFIYQI